jgi:deoxyadenosine/deoxycytidine kinase
MTSASKAKQYRKKMRTEIDEYIKLRTHAQKVKPNQHSTDRMRPSKTAHELLSLIKQKT